MLSIQTLLREVKQPLPYAPGAELWNDPHISGEMLKAHLSADTDAASYKPKTIRDICSHLPNAMGLKNGDTIIDLGCGPGLYCRQLLDKGYRVTGVDRSKQSIKHARGLCQGENASFFEASYLEPFGNEDFHAALLIYQDYGVLAPENRKKLLKNIYDALKPGGWFALDVPSLFAFSQRQQKEVSHWSVSEQGFWRPHPYLALEKTYFYPDLSVLCDLVAVLDEEWTVYRIWQTFFSMDTISCELMEGGFSIEAVWANLKGESCYQDSPVLGLLCRKM